MQLTMAISKNDSAIHELFRTIERYDMKMFIEAAASDCNPRVISTEEMHRLLRYQNKTKMCAKLKKLLINDADRLTKFAHFTFTYNVRIHNAAQEALIHLNNRADAEVSTHKEPLQYSFLDLITVQDSVMIQQQALHESSQSSGNSSPSSPMDFVSSYKVNLAIIIIIIHYMYII